MMEEYVLNIIRSNLPLFEAAIVEYFGQEYYEGIHSKLMSTEFVISRGSGLCNIGGVEVYLVDEPICLKKENGSFIVLPLNFLKIDSCNIAFTHLLLHSILREFENEDVSIFYETLIDYMADDMGDLLKNNKASICTNKEVSYTSHSVYSKFYDFVEKYYLDNKEQIIDMLMGDEKIYLNDEEEKIANNIQNAFDNYCFNIEREKKNNIIKK